MPDISLCKNYDCVLKNNCYRYKAVPSEKQAYSMFFPREDGSCEFFYDIRKMYNPKIDKNGD